ncbi:MAG: hypothetical protein OHK0045_22920 [Raineya sp.]
MTLAEMEAFLSEIPKIVRLLEEVVAIQKKSYQKKYYLSSSEARIYLQCSYTQLHRYTQSMRIEKTEEGYNAYDCQQVYERNKSYRTFHRPKDWKEQLKLILL